MLTCLVELNSAVFPAFLLEPAIMQPIDRTDQFCDSLTPERFTACLEFVSRNELSTLPAGEIEVQIKYLLSLIADQQSLCKNDRDVAFDFTPDILYLLTYDLCRQELCRLVFCFGNSTLAQLILALQRLVQAALVRHRLVARSKAAISVKTGNCASEAR